MSNSQQIADTLSFLNKVEKRSVREMRELIFALEEKMKELPNCVGPEAFKTTHHFEKGIYMREVFIPKDSLVTGRIHKSAHLNILSQGKLTVWTEDGMKTLTASTTIRSQPGIKRVGYAHEDSVWITVHTNPSDERDIKKVEDRLFADTFDQAYLSSSRTFEDAITFLGFSKEEVQSYSENEHDYSQCIFDYVYLADSPIDKRGVFSKHNIKQGTVLGRARSYGIRTVFGRYCNHSGDPNIEMVMQEQDNVVVVTLKDIKKDEELVNDYYLSFVNSRPWGERILCQQ